jgi:hypothetical protein
MDINYVRRFRKGILALSCADDTCGPAILKPRSSNHPRRSNRERNDLVRQLRQGVSFQWKPFCN